ncbi:unnamed protein product [Linum tenue]|uniref:Uncharacterized protein n=1 Tax=Linum tenue TaxID=586396 RepID=A0AAV0NGJ6_9ROSI|nr:unnamed protein product [Linum tenue]
MGLTCQRIFSLC